jgi:hypothetical protein
VSDLGRVAKVDEEGQRWILSQSKTEKDYRRVSLRTPDSEWKCLRVHRLVAAAFYGGNHPDKDVNHLDGTPYHNDVENLAWATRSENMQHAARMGLIPNLKLNPQDVLEIRAFCGQESAKDVAARYGVGDRTVRDIWAGRRWGHVVNAQPSAN